MTEAEWLECDSPVPMLRCLQGDASDRKLRLFGCVCCRRHWHLLTDERSRMAVEMAELWADGLATEAELEAAQSAADQAKDDRVLARHDSEYSNSERFTNAARAAGLLATVNPFSTDRCLVVAGYCRVIALHETGERDRPESDDISLCTIIRDIFGNPFRPATFSPAWRTDTAVSLARGMYESRDFSAMPILADALQDAGCDSDDILAHCRDANATHVRGCWVVDLVLGKE
jgi:hypothetical protein